ncbi:hypothetical protein [Bacillus toyonensis]|uniref:hypothetical protein n=1 Tax=Bacillus toyonensis TaxID=155322 RepID=UPI000BF833FE|nr:hypothetical protein [Bacillus toyonensis]PGF05086.1 hypothetical protein COM61_01245 [Bacillus toyonensis]
MNYKVLMDDKNGRGLYSETVEAYSEDQVKMVVAELLPGKLVTFKEIKDKGDIVYYKGFELHINETKDVYGKPRGDYFTIIKADTVEGAIDYINKKYGEVISIHRNVLFVDKDTRLEQLHDGQEYYIQVKTEYETDVLEIFKEGNRIYTKAIGGESVRPFEHSFLVEETIKEFNKRGFFKEFSLNTLTLKHLEELNFEVYNMVSGLSERPEEFDGIVF